MMSIKDSMWTGALRQRTVLAVLTLALLVQTTGASAGFDKAEAVRPQSAEPSQNEFRWNGRLAPGRVVEIKGVNGNVHAEAARGGEVEVSATKRGRRSDPSEVRIQVVEHADGVTICAVYPSPDPSRPNGCEPGDSWRSNTRNNDVEVSFTVRVPAGVRFNGRTVNGQVEANSLAADVRASTVNGGVQVSTTGLAEATTVNGSIVAKMGSAEWAGGLRFTTVNGSIDLELPATTNTEVRAQTVNGDISTDFPITVQGRFGKRSMQGTIGSGGRTLELTTVNGAIQIRRAP